MAASPSRQLSWRDWLYRTPPSQPPHGALVGGGRSETRENTGNRGPTDCTRAQGKPSSASNNPAPCTSRHKRAEAGPPALQSSSIAMVLNTVHRNRQRLLANELRQHPRDGVAKCRAQRCAIIGHKATPPAGSWRIPCGSPPPPGRGIRPRCRCDYHGLNARGVQTCVASLSTATKSSGSQGGVATEREQINARGLAPAAALRSSSRVCGYRCREPCVSRKCAARLTASALLTQVEQGLPWKRVVIDM